MRALKLTLIFLSFVAINGCEILGPSLRVTPPRVKIEGVKVEAVEVETHGKQKHCPPGQAKKGNC